MSLRTRCGFLLAALATIALYGPRASDAAALTPEDAAAAQKAFRTIQRPKIEAQGWRFVVSAGYRERSDSDVFVQDIRRKEGSLRSAWFLIASYELVYPSVWDATPKLPYQSTKVLYWFDCSDLSYEYRQGAAYLHVDGTGRPSDSTNIPTSQAPSLKESAPNSLLRDLASAVCR